MAYINQEQKAHIASILKTVVPASWKYTLSVRDHSTLVLTIKSAPVDLIAEINECRRAAAEDRHQAHLHNDAIDYAQINPYYLSNEFGASLPIMQAIKDAMNTNNYDNSDTQRDHFDVGHYIRINVGNFSRPFVVAPAKAAA